MDSDSSSESTPVEKKPIVVGLYGIPGTGKTTLLNQLKQQMDANDFAFYDGSDFLSTVMATRGLETVSQLPEEERTRRRKAFFQLSDEEKTRRREEAITNIAKGCTASGRVGVVAGHALLWPENGSSEAGGWTITNADLNTYTHIIYLDVPAKIVADQRRNDTKRARQPVSEAHMDKWQSEEKRGLRQDCYKHGILLSILRSQTCGPDSNVLDHIQELLLNFKDHDEQTNLVRAKAHLDEIVDGSSFETMLVFDADRTLTAEAVGSLFFDEVSSLLQKSGDDINSLKSLFDSAMQYSYTASRQAMALYEDIVYEIGDAAAIAQLCKNVADKVTIRPEIQALLKVVVGSQHGGAMAVTCGSGYIWELIVKRAGLIDKVKVVAGGRLYGDYVITAAVKGALVSHLQEQHDIYVLAFADSSLDLEMLRNANEAIIVVGVEQGRSTTMGEALRKAIDNGDLKAHQLLLPFSVSSRLDITKLPEIDLTDIATHVEFSRFLFLAHATEKGAAKILITPTRDASVQGPALQNAHRRIGEYLAIEFLADIIGLEEYNIQHVQRGKAITGYRLPHEDKALVVALMHNGLPMAEGVNRVFPRATMLQARVADDVTSRALAGRSVVMLVDAVINKGATVKKYIEHIRKLDMNVRIVVVAGVVQAQSVGKGGPVQKLARKYGKISIVALRLSENEVIGSGTTDSGNRLFNSTQLG